MTHPAALTLRQLAALRRSTRAFHQDSVPPELIRSLLETAALAPSTFNTQPWRVHVLAGESLQRLSEAILASEREGTHPAFTPFPLRCPAELRELQQEFGRRYCEVLDISRDDTSARARQTARNYEFFGAPAGLMLTIARELTEHSWLDLGLFLQTFMLAACERGLATCPQVSFLRYEDVIARRLGFAREERLACGLSLGWPDMHAAVNRLEMPRLSVDAFARWHAVANPS